MLDYDAPLPTASIPKPGSPNTKSNSRNLEFETCISGNATSLLEIENGTFSWKCRNFGNRGKIAGRGNNPRTGLESLRVPRVSPGALPGGFSPETYQFPASLDIFCRDKFFDARFLSKNSAKTRLSRAYFSKPPKRGRVFYPFFSFRFFR